MGADFSQSPRLGREFRTVAAMIRIYCRARHAAHVGARPRDLCPECLELTDYARQRLARCVFGEGKPTCVKCPVHCYQARMREKIRDVMRFAGPRMLLRHPVLAIRHLIDEKRPAPSRVSPKRKPS